MNPESIDYLGTAERTLDRARRALAAGILEDAARDAYLAALSAVRAIIFERTGEAVKTHRGARTRLHALINSGLPLDRDLVEFLAEGFEVKQKVDYGPAPVGMTTEIAEGYVKLAARFVAAAKELCGEQP